MSKVSIEELKKLKKLLDEGIISQEEFEQKKAEFLKKEEPASVKNNFSTLPGKKKKNPFKIGCLTLVIIFVVLVIIGSLFPDEENKTENKPQQKVEQKKEEEKKEPTANDLKAFDEKSFEDFKEIVKFYNASLNAMQNINDVNNYDIIKKSKDYFASKSTELRYGNSKEENDVLSCLQMMCVKAQTTCRYAIKYVDSSKMSDLSKSKENMEEFKNLVSSYVINRKALLEKAGYSESEIDKMMQEMANLEF